MPAKDTYARKNVIRYGIYQVAFLLMSLGNCISTLFDMNSTGYHRMQQACGDVDEER